MRGILGILLAALLGLAVACGGATPTPEPPTATPEPTVAATVPMPPTLPPEPTLAPTATVVPTPTATAAPPPPPATPAVAVIAVQCADGSYHEEIHTTAEAYILPDPCPWAATPEPWPTPEPLPTYTPYPTRAVLPTYTPYPTPAPTPTIAPTYTPYPTPTVIPTPSVPAWSISRVILSPREANFIPFTIYLRHRNKTAATVFWRYRQAGSSEWINAPYSNALFVAGTTRDSGTWYANRGIRPGQTYELQFSHSVAFPPLTTFYCQIAMPAEPDDSLDDPVCLGGEN